MPDSLPTNEIYLENAKKAERHLERFKGSVLGHFINGKHTLGAAGKVLDNISPINGRVINQIAAGTAEDIDAAAQAARNAFPEWRNMPATERRHILHKIADLIVARAEEISLLECLDTGQALRFMSKAAIRGAENYRFFADKAPESNCK